MWEDESKVLLGPKIFFELGDEIEGRWLDPVFKACKDSVDGHNAHVRSSLRWSSNLEEKEWEGGKLMLIVEIRFEETYFNTGRTWETDEETHPLEILLWSFMFEFTIMSLSILDVDSNL